MLALFLGIAALIWMSVRAKEREVRRLLEAGLEKRGCRFVTMWHWEFGWRRSGFQTPTFKVKLLEPGGKKTWARCDVRTGAWPGIRWLDPVPDKLPAPGS